MSERPFRPEIQGIRAIAALLVAIYHLWFNRISGGVDVFFVVSGLLITESLLRRLERDGRVELRAYLTRLFKRLLPAAMVVLLAVIAASWIWLPQVRWSETVGEVVASALYYENWQLALTSTDYLAEGAARSPVQHYWALSIQGQFYLIWPAVFAAVAFVSTRLGASIRQGLAVAFASIFSASLVYSIFVTVSNQAFNYFNTGARIWEFALGGLLALALPSLVPGSRVRFVLGVLGFLAMISAGLLIPGEMFPGYASLWPTLAAVCMIVAGSGYLRYGAERLLTSRPIQWLGGISYSLYLWHWPLMILFLAAKDQEELRNGQAIGILLVAVLLAWLTTRLVENPLRFSRLGWGRSWHGPAFALACVLPVLLVAGGWQKHLDRQAALLDRYLVDNLNYPGAVTLLAGINPASAHDVPVIPPLALARDDVPAIYREGCHQLPHKAEVLSCNFGSDQAELTLALVGGSHAAHWLPALRRLAEENDWRVVTFTKSACRFTAIHTRGHPSCEEWNRKLVERIAELEPNLVFTTGTVGNGSDEHVPDGFVRQWEAMDDLNIPVLALRDTPRIGFDAPECVERHGADADDCSWHLHERRSAANPLRGHNDLPGNVHAVDLLDAFCVESHCPAVIGNVLVYRDDHHITTTYAKTTAPALQERMQPLLDRARSTGDSPD